MIRYRKFKNIIALSVVALLLAISVNAAEKPLDNILKNYPAKDAAQFKSANAQLVQLGQDGLVDLCSRLTPKQQSGDEQVRFAINGLTKYVKLQNDESNRKVVVQAFLTSLNKTDDYETKAFLIRQIQFIGKEEVIAPLSRYLTDEVLCEPAANALFAISSPEASAALLFALPQVNDSLKPTIIKTLGDLQSRAASLAITPYTESDDLNIRLMAYYAIANIGDPSASNPLKRALTKTSGYEQTQAISAYLLFANRLAEAQAEDKALTIYRSLLDTYSSAEDIRIQNAALSGIAAIEGDNALPMLLDAMDSPYKSYRNVALKIAQTIQGNKATWAWIEKSKSVSPEVRAEILTLLGKRGDKIALPVLLEALNDADINVKLEALAASFTLGGLESVPYYSGLLQTDNVDLINAVKNTLLQVPGDYLLTTISYVLPNVPVPAKVALLDIIAQRKSEASFYDVMTYLEDENASVRLAAAKALKDIGTIDQLQDLVALFDIASIDEAKEIENAIFVIVDAQGSNLEKVDALKNAFSAVARMDQGHLINVLARIRGEYALKAVVPFLTSPNLKQQAAEAVVQIVCPQEGDGFGLCTNQAYDALTGVLPLLSDELAERAKKHLPASLPEADDEGFVSIFNGEDMNGWIWDNSWKGGDNGYKVVDGILQCDPKKTGAGNIYTDREYSDFIFRFEFQLPAEANNGVGVRAPVSGDSAYNGMEIQILDHDHPTYNGIKPYQAHGSVYGIIPAERGYLKPTGEWNQEEIKIDGRWVTVTLNGHVITDGHLDRARMPKTLDGRNHPGAARPIGHLGFLGHGHPVAFRNLKVKELNKEPKRDNVPPAGFTALFNGKDLTNWKGLVANPPKRAAMSKEELAAAQEQADQRMRDHWHPFDGMLVFDGKGDSLCTIKDYGDFELLVDWKIKEKGDSGIYLRGSPQVQIWDTQNFNLGSGGLYNNQKNPSKPICEADNPIGEWNSFRIIMVGERVTIYLNDVLVVDNVILENYWERDKPIYPTGQIELQNHGNTLYFKNIYIREL